MHCGICAAGVFVSAILCIQECPFHSLTGMRCMSYYVLTVLYISVLTLIPVNCVKNPNQIPGIFCPEVCQTHADCYRLTQNRGARCARTKCGGCECKVPTIDVSHVTNPGPLITDTRKTVPRRFSEYSLGNSYPKTFSYPNGNYHCTD